MEDRAQTELADDLERLAKEYGALLRAYAQADKEALDLVERAAKPIREELHHIHDRITGVEEQASWLTARTVMGAMFQVSLLRRCVEEAADAEPLEEADLWRRRGARLTRSALAILAATGDVPIQVIDPFFEDVGGGVTQRVNRRLAAIQSSTL